MSYYALFFGTGTAMFLCHVMMNALYLIRLFTKVDVESIAGLTKSVSLPLNSTIHTPP